MSDVDKLELTCDAEEWDVVTILWDGEDIEIGVYETSDEEASWVTLGPPKVRQLIEFLEAALEDSHE